MIITALRRAGSLLGDGRRRVLPALLLFAILLVGPVGIVQAQDLPERASVSGLAGYPQRFSLSCESRSAVDWAGFWGVSIREKRFLNELPRSDNPDAGFVGDPDGEWGNLPPRSYGVHAEPVAALLRQYGLQAEARRGLSWDDLRIEIAAGRPVIVWVIGQMWRGDPVRYKAADGSQSRVARFEHTMILTGYTPDSVIVVDAFSGKKQTYSRRAFMASWETLGRMAITGGRPAVQEPTPEPAPNPTPKPSPASLPASFSHRQYLPLVFGPGKAQAAEPAPRPDSYRVKRGDTLLEVARRFGMGWQRLAALNGIQYPYVIYTGQVLRLK